MVSADAHLDDSRTFFDSIIEKLEKTMPYEILLVKSLVWKCIET